VIGRKLRLVATLGLGGLAVGGSPGASSGFELPGLGSLLGTGDPLAALPETLPAVGSLRVTGEIHDLYRREGGGEVRRYSQWTTTVAGLGRVGPVWAGWRYGSARLDLRLEDVHDEEDVLDGDRDVEHHAAIVAGRWRGWEGRLVARPGDEAEAAFELRGPGPGLESAGIRGWWWRSETNLDQELRGTTFHFPFAYRDASLEVRGTTKPWRGWRGAGRLRLQRIDGDEPHPEQYNRFDARRSRLELELERIRSPRIDARARWEQAKLGVEAVLDGTAYARAQDLFVTGSSVEAGWSPHRAWRVAAGWDGWWTASDDKSYVDIWPFTVWDVFTSTRFRLEKLRGRWDAVYLRGGWTDAVVRTPVRVGVDARLERWFTEGDLFWKNRVPTFPPFFFRFDHHVDGLDPRYRWGAQLDTFAEAPIGSRLRVRIDARLVAPFGREDDGEPGEDGGGGGTGEPPPPDEGERKERGGLTARASLELAW
jgi:hypothetical protein